MAGLVVGGTAPNVGNAAGESESSRMPVTASFSAHTEDAGPRGVRRAARLWGQDNTKAPYRASTRGRLEHLVLPTRG